MESLRTLWLQLSLLRSQNATTAINATGINERIREICLDVDRQRTAAVEVSALGR